MKGRFPCEHWCCATGQLLKGDFSGGRFRVGELAEFAKPLFRECGWTVWNRRDTIVAKFALESAFAD
jgi:hypothetical protein